MVKGDIETGNPDQLYPGMMESPQMRWAFIGKVYSILSIQFFLTAVVAALVVFVKAIPNFIVNSGTPGHAVYVVIIILPFLLLCPLYILHKHHPWNFIFLMLFTVTIAFAVGLSCAFTEGRIVLEAAILTSVVVVGLTAYTFWAVKRGKDFSFLGPFLFASLLVLFVFSFIQILFPLGKLSHAIYGGVSAIIFCGFIVYDTDNLIKRYTYDEYIIASVAIYLDVINLFLSLLTLFTNTD
ncbi:protein LIFEGUARD 2-like [Mangifera indica]|uniref:protein LIFEGUARD 2-like n=1 Tax=Mangifera indica TaxID=29780 RepID=UPI001CFB7188|nr:protein LIFEGUARD 2-like [Mangifera indica]